MPFELDLFPYASELNVVNKDGVAAFFDPTRKIHLKVTPEETVRQALIVWLHEVKKISFSLMRTEYEIKKGRLSRRIDIVVSNNAGQPQMIVETKAPSVKLSRSTADQAAFYNNTIFAPWLMLANGDVAAIYAIDFDKKQTLEVTDFPELNLI